MLRNAATDLGPIGWDPYYGAGFLNLDPFIQKPEYYTVSYMANGGEGAPRRDSINKRKIRCRV